MPGRDSRHFLHVRRLKILLIHRISTCCIACHSLQNGVKVLKNMENGVKTTLIKALVMAVCAMSLSGCVPVAVGAVGAVAVDSVAEDRGQDLF